MKCRVSSLVLCAVLSGGIADRANAASYFLGDQEIAPEHAGAVQSHCELLADEQAALEDGGFGEGAGEPEEAFTDPPMGLGDVEEEDEGDDEENGSDEDDEDGPDFSAIDIEDCKGAGLIP